MSYKCSVCGCSVGPNIRMLRNVEYRENNQIEKEHPVCPAHKKDEEKIVKSPTKKSEVKLKLKLSQDILPEFDCELR